MSPSPPLPPTGVWSLPRQTPTPPDDSGAVAVPLWDSVATVGPAEATTPTAEADPPAGPQGNTRHLSHVDLHGQLPETPELPTVAGYELLGILGQGGMGVVYKARQVQLKRLVALKMLLDGPFARTTTLHRFQAEAEMVARLHHPNFVQIYEVGQQDGRPFFALELVEGGSLAQMLSGRPMPARDAVQLVAALAHAMDYAHQLGVVHRDLKPANVLLTKAGTPKITDFGLAKQLDTDHGHTQTGVILGTPSYMAPEQAAGQRDGVGPPADVYALGAILFECLTGRPPFQGETGWDTVLQVMQTDAPPPSRFQPRLAHDLDTICLKALAKLPAERYSSARALAEDLDRFGAGEVILARPEGRLRKFVRRVRRRPAGVSLLGVLTCLLVGGALFAGANVRERHREAAIALAEGQESIQRRDYDEAVRRLEHGRAVAARLPGGTDLRQRLAAEWRRASRGKAAEDLHKLAERFRFWLDAEGLSDGQRRAFAQYCRQVWDARTNFAPDIGRLAPDEEDRIRTDLLDLALLWTGLHVRLADGRPEQARAEAFQVLEEAEALYGPSPVLALVRRDLRPPGTGTGEVGVSEKPPTTSWEYYALGRARMLDDPAAAEGALRAAVDLQPAGFWPHFYRGVCAQRRGHAADAVTAFSVCIALAPATAECYFNRGLAYEQQEQFPSALKDYDRALRLNPRLAAASLNRALLYSNHLQDHERAVADLETALADGYDPAVVHYNLARVHLDAGRPELARDHLAKLFKLQPNHAAGQELLRRLSPAR